MKKHLVFGLLVLGFMLSCDKKLKYKEDDSKELMVINCVMEANDLITVSLTRSYSTIGNQNVGDLTIVSEANLKLIDETTGDVYTVNQISADNNYHFSTTALAGHSYYIEVTHPDFPTASARCKMPDMVYVNSWDTLTLSSTEKKFSFQFNDPQEENYYGIRRSVIDANTGVEQEDGFNEVEGLLNVNKNYWGSHLLFSDDQLTSSSPTLGVRFMDYSSNGGAEINGYKVLFSHVSKELYLYSKTSNLIQENEFNPFAEPVRIYCNIENGYGIFAGFSTTVVFVE
jgi:hypothetical protein